MDDIQKELKNVVTDQKDLNELRLKRRLIEEVYWKLLFKTILWKKDYKKVYVLNVWLN